MPLNAFNGGFIIYSKKIFLVHAFLLSWAFSQSVRASGYLGVCEVQSFNQNSNESKVHPTMLGPFPDKDTCDAIMVTYCEGEAIANFWKAFSGSRDTLKNQIKDGTSLLIAAHMCVPVPPGFQQKPHRILIPDIIPRKVLDGTPRKDSPHNNFKNLELVPIMMPNGFPLFVPMKPGSPTYNFIMEVNHVLSIAPKILIALIIGVLVITGIILAAEAIAASVSAGVTLTLAPATIAAAASAIITLCAWYGVKVNEQKLRGGNTPGTAWIVEETDKNICIVEKAEGANQPISWCVPKDS